MKTLSHLQNEAIERFEKQCTIVRARGKGEAKFRPVVYFDNEMQENTDKLKDFLRQELETIVKESFKNTRVTRRTKDGECLICGEATEECTCQIALSDKHNKEKTFLGE